MATEVNYIVGNRKYLRGSFSPTGCRISFTNLIKNQETQKKKIRRLRSKGELLLLVLNIIHEEKLSTRLQSNQIFFIVKVVSLNSFILTFYIPADLI